ncbi:hypothetical protein, partial [Burkholderia pseudomallei]|uniref:hypothetical protein n=1 Tax=Burkholderia pseudomallei TaxID=28450 RepID=UPI001C4C2B33
AINAINAINAIAERAPNERGARSGMIHHARVAASSSARPRIRAAPRFRRAIDGSRRVSALASATGVFARPLRIRRRPATQSASMRRQLGRVGARGDADLNLRPPAAAA